jgi:hypothetical protein
VGNGYFVAQSGRRDQLAVDHGVSGTTLHPREQTPQYAYELGDGVGRRLGVQLGDEPAAPQEGDDVFLRRSPIQEKLHRRSAHQRRDERHEDERHE